MSVRESVCWDLLGYDVSVVSASSYIVDWLTYLVMLGIAIIWGTVAIPHKSDFSADDISIMHQHIWEPETYAPIWYLVLMVLGLPVFIIAVSCYWYLRDRNKARMLWDIHQAILGSLGAVAAQLLLVVIIKNTAGIQRPDFLSRCVPDFNLVPDSGLTTDVICTQTIDFLMKEGYRSFPSGHASTIFASQTFLSLFLIGKTKMDAVHYFSWKMAVAVVYPLTVALKISFSRVSDNRHTVTDILMGSFIGFFFGLTFYFLYFTSPFSEKMSIAVCPRRFEIIDNITDRIQIKISRYDIDSEDVHDDVNREKYTESIDNIDGNFALPLQHAKARHNTISHFNNRTRPHTVNVTSMFQV